MRRGHAIDKPIKFTIQGGLLLNHGKADTNRLSVTIQGGRLLNHGKADASNESYGPVYSTILHESDDRRLHTCDDPSRVGHR